jgi:ribose/xylose/arabinose/galactoside ABC-type transport system permease subunit
MPTNDLETLTDSPDGSPRADTTTEARPARASGSSRDMFSSVATVVALGIVFVIYAVWLKGSFYNVSRLSYDASRSAPQVALAVAVAVCLCGRRFDLSVASIATGGAFMCLGLFLRGGTPIGVAIAVTLIAGGVAGLLNGLLVTVFRVNAFIATLGSSGLFAGFTVVYSSGEVVGPTPNGPSLPSWFSGAGSIGDFQTKVPLALALIAILAVFLAMFVSFDQRFPGPDRLRRVRVVSVGVLAILCTLGAWAIGIPGQFDWMIIIMIALTLAVWIGMKYTAVGHAIYALGGNESAARFAGIDIKRISVALFIFSGLISALAGLLIASQQGSAAPAVADPLLLPAYAGAFLSTVILSRGRFHVWGTVAGSLALVYVTDGLVVGGVPYTWTQVINGAVLIVTVAMSTFLQRSTSK